jgi:hypothetical protein
MVKLKEIGKIVLVDNYGRADIEIRKSNTLIELNIGDKWVQVKMRNGKPRLYTHISPKIDIWKEK